jgi:hypothetical protein
VLLGLAVELGHDLRAREGDEVGVHLVCHGLCYEGLTRARRPVEEHPLRRLDADPLEELGVPEGELDHLPDELELSPEAPDILVVDVGDLVLPLLLLPGLVGLLLELDLGVVGDHPDALGDDLCDHEGEGVPEDVHPDGLPLLDRAAPEEPGEVLLPANEPDGLGRLDHHLLGIDNLDLPDPHLLVDTGAGVRPDGPVDPDHRLPRVLRVAGPDHGGGLLPPLDLDDVPRDQGEGLHDVQADAGDAPARVAEVRLLHRDFRRIL